MADTTDNRINVQTVYTIDAADLQIRAAADQGPMQNAAVDTGAVPVALRSLPTDSTSPSYYVTDVISAYDTIVAPELTNPNTSFVGVKLGGDIFDLGCEQEKRSIFLANDQLMARDPNLRVVQVARGNHDGGQYMGVVNSGANFFLVGILYPDLIFDQQQNICGNRAAVEEVHETVEDFDYLSRGVVYKNEVEKKKQEFETRAAEIYLTPVPDSMSLNADQTKIYHDGQDKKVAQLEREIVGPTRQVASLDHVLVEVTKANKRRFVSEGVKHKFDDIDTTFDYLWQSTPDQKRWDLTVHYGKKPYDFHREEDHQIDHGDTRTNGDISLQEGEVRQWYQLMALQDAEFKSVKHPEVTVPVYDISMDTNDFTEFSALSASIKGHVGTQQVNDVEVFMDKMLKSNPHAKFKLKIHYSPKDLVPCALKRLKELLAREEVILVISAHNHVRDEIEDLNEVYKLKRETPLMHYSMASTTDAPRDLTVEKMVFSENADGSGYRIDFEFTYKHLTEEELAPKPLTEAEIASGKFSAEEIELRNKSLPIYETLEELERALISRKLELYETYAKKGIKTRRLIDSQGSPKWIYLNQEEVIAQLDDPLLKLIAHGKANRQMQGWTAFKMFVGLGDGLSHALTVEASIPQMRMDFESFMPVLECMKGLLDEEGFESKGEELQKKIEKMKDYYEIWKMDFIYDKEEQHYGNDAMRRSDNLYRSTDLQGVYDFINALPSELMAKKFALIVGMRASDEEARYHYGDTSKLTEVPDVQSVSLDFDY